MRVLCTSLLRHARTCARKKQHNRARTTTRHPPLLDILQSVRVPSWCDRVLWHSLPAFSRDVKCDRYSAHPGVPSSDHKPVSAAFTLKCVPPTMPRPAPRDSSFPFIEFISLRGSDLIVRRAALFDMRCMLEHAHTITRTAISMTARCACALLLYASFRIAAHGCVWQERPIRVVLHSSGHD